MSNWTLNTLKFVAVIISSNHTPDMKESDNDVVADAFLPRTQAL